jgi:hypothetical protein
MEDKHVWEANSDPERPLAGVPLTSFCSVRSLPAHVRLAVDHDCRDAVTQRENLPASVIFFADLSSI